MQDQQRPSAFGRAASHRVHQQHLVREVERGGRLVEHQEQGVLGERAREEDALALAARELRHGTVRQIEHVHFGERRVRKRPVAGRFESPQPEVRRAPHQRDFAGGEGDVRRLVLREERDATGALPAR